MTVYTKTPIGLIEDVYSTFEERLKCKKKLGRQLTYAEKVLINHLDSPDQSLDRGPRT